MNHQRALREIPEASEWYLPGERAYAGVKPDAMLANAVLNLDPFYSAAGVHESDNETNQLITGFYQRHPEALQEHTWFNCRACNAVRCQL